jgi:hypothetical protein
MLKFVENGNLPSYFVSDWENVANIAIKIDHDHDPLAQAFHAIAKQTSYILL